jgi:hypothetical protein
VLHKREEHIHEGISGVINASVTVVAAESLAWGASSNDIDLARAWACFVFSPNTCEELPDIFMTEVRMWVSEPVSCRRSVVKLIGPQNVDTYLRHAE